MQLENNMAALSDQKSFTNISNIPWLRSYEIKITCPFKCMFLYLGIRRSNVLATFKLYWQMWRNLRMPG